MNRWTCANCDARNESDGDAGFCATCGAPLSAKAASKSGAIGGFLLGIGILIVEFVTTWSASRGKECFAAVGPITGAVAVVAGLFLYEGIRAARSGLSTRSHLWFTAGFVALVPTAACAAGNFSRTSC